MKISGFSFVRNGSKLYYPVVESIKSILPICDEFVIAVGKGDEDDTTRELIENINSSKIRIIDTEWTDREKLKGKIHSQQTNIALRECKGDWCFYVQSDEVVHEDDLSEIKRRCEELLHDDEVEGLLFRYNHFWGDYDHVHRNHAWYPREIRIIKNGKGIVSWNTAQSFRKPDGAKLNVADVDAEIFHYGWVRPPHFMQKKRREFGQTHLGRKVRDEVFEGEGLDYHYGSLEKVPEFKGTHPEVMNDMISKFSWGDQLQYKGKSPVPHKHEQFKYRLMSFIEYKIFGGSIHLGGNRWNLISK